MKLPTLPQLPSRESKSDDDVLKDLAQSRKINLSSDKIFKILAAIGAIYAVVSVLGSVFSPSAPKQDLTGTGSIPQAQLAGSFAEDFVVAYLGSRTGQEEDLKHYITKDVNLPPVPSKVVDSRVVFLKMISNKNNVAVWTVTVSAAVSSTTAVNPARIGRSYFTVPIAVMSGAPRAIEVPAQVAGPAAGIDLATAYGTQLNSSSPTAQTATGFLTAYLTGGSDINRYATADSSLTAIDPAPYSAVKLEDIRATGNDRSASEGQTLSALVTITAQTKNYATTTLTYPLTMRAVSGQWYVASIDPVPVINGKPSSPADQTTTETTPASTTVPAPTRN